MMAIVEAAKYISVGGNVVVFSSVDCVGAGAAVNVECCGCV